MESILNIISELTSSFGTLVTVILILIIGWIIAKSLKKLTEKIAEKAGIDKALKSDKVKISELIAKLVYFLVMIFVFMLALEKLGMTSVLEPVKNLLNGFTDFIPNIVGAGLVCYIGYMLATIVSELVGLSGNTIQKFAPKLRLPENIDLVLVLKKVVFIFIFIPLLISALNILNLDSISEPATNMLQSFFDAIPKVLTASLILILFVVGGRFLSGLLKDLLSSLNLNNILTNAGLNVLVGKTNIESLIANVFYTFIVSFGLVTAIEKLEFTQLTDIMHTIIALGGNILFGLIIIAMGNWISTLASTNFVKSEGNPFIGKIIRFGTLAVFFAIGLRKMGIANDIINLAFGITLGAIALTCVLAFGLGGRDSAGKQMDKILDKFNKK